MPISHDETVSRYPNDNVVMVLDGAGGTNARTTASKTASATMRFIGVLRSSAGTAL